MSASAVYLRTQLSQLQSLPERGPQEAHARSAPSLTERTQEAAGVSRTDPTSPAVPASSSSRAPLQTPVPDTLNSTVAGSCRGVVVQTTGLGGYTAASWAAETEQLGWQPHCQAGAWEEAFQGDRMGRGVGGIRFSMPGASG